MKRLALIAAAFGLAAVPAAAHHSFAMFDDGKTVTLVGTVKSLDLINPHSWLEVAVPDAAGQINSWSLEMGGAGQVARQGITPGILKAGDKVSVRAHPLRDGSYGGQFVSVTLPNGQVIGRRG